jgi:hypothetical protein
MKITFYINFDLNIRGDYKGLYKWLDKNKAEERGSNYAIIKKYDFPDEKIEGLTKVLAKNNAFAKHLKEEINEYVTIGKSDRIYLTLKVFGRENIGGIFLFGRKQSDPWEGTYTEDDNTDDNFDF